MNLIMLVQAEHFPIPENVTVVQNYGPEQLRSEEGVFLGECVLLSADPAAFVAWLGKFDGIWTSLNPMMGEWEVVHIADELLGGLSED